MRTISTYNRDDGDIDFSDSIVLGLSNPLNLSGLDMAYEVSDSLICGFAIIMATSLKTL